MTPVKQALAEIRSLRARLAEAESSGREPIAIVGMGMRFPGGVHDAEGFSEYCGPRVTPSPKSHRSGGRWIRSTLRIPTSRAR